MIGNEIPMTTLDDCSAVREPPDCGLTAEFSAFLKAVCEADKELAAEYYTLNVCDLVRETITWINEHSPDELKTSTRKKLFIALETRLRAAEDNSTTLYLDIFSAIAKSWSGDGDELWKYLLKEHNALLERIVELMDTRYPSSELLHASIGLLEEIMSAQLASEWYLTTSESPFAALFHALKGTSCVDFGTGVVLLQRLVSGKIKLFLTARRFFSASVVNPAFEKIAETLKNTGNSSNLALISCRFLTDVLASGQGAAIYLMRKYKMIQETLWMLTDSDRKYRIDVGQLLLALSKCQDGSCPIIDDLLLTKPQCIPENSRPDLSHIIVHIVVKKLSDINVKECDDMGEIFDTLQLVFDSICLVEGILRCEVKFGCKEGVKTPNVLETVLDTLVESAAMFSNVKEPQELQVKPGSQEASLKELTIILVRCFLTKLKSSDIRNSYFFLSMLTRTFDRVHKSLSCLSDKKQSVIADFLVNSAILSNSQEGQHLRNVGLLCLKDFVTECSLDHTCCHILDRLSFNTSNEGVMHALFQDCSINYSIKVYLALLSREYSDSEDNGPAQRAVIAKVEAVLKKVMTHRSEVAMVVIDNLINKLPQRCLNLLSREFIILVLERLKLAILDKRDGEFLRGNIMSILKFAEATHYIDHHCYADLGKVVISNVIDMMASPEAEPKSLSLSVLHKIIFSGNLLSFACLDKELRSLSWDKENQKELSDNKERQINGLMSITLDKLHSNFNAAVCSETYPEFSAELMEFSIGVVCKCLEDLALCNNSVDMELPLMFFFRCGCDNLIFKSLTPHPQISTGSGLPFELLRVDRRHVLKCFKLAADVDVYHNIPRVLHCRLHAFVKKFLSSISPVEVIINTFDERSESIKSRATALVEQLKTATRAIQNPESCMIESYYECSES